MANAKLQFLKTWMPGISPKANRLIRRTLQNQTLRWTGRLPKLRRMNFEVTDVCNSRCSHCNIWKNTGSPDMLTVEDVRKIFADPVFDLEFLIITGGEPVMRKDLSEFILAIHESHPNCLFALSTAGFLPKRVLEVVDTLIANNVKLTIGISLDALGEQHDEIRGLKGNFEKVHNLVQDLKERRRFYPFDIVLGHTLSERTAGTTIPVAEYAESQDVDFLTQLYEEFTFYHNTGEIAVEEVADHTPWTRADRVAIRQQLIDEVEQLEPAFHNEVLLRALRGESTRFQCWSLRTFAFMHCNGDVSPCLRFFDVRVGNMRDQSPTEVWKSAKAWETRKKVVEPCNGCSNTWQTGWSAGSNPLSFMREIRRTVRKKLFSKKDYIRHGQS